jgi:hypothetical protein
VGERRVNPRQPSEKEPQRIRFIKLVLVAALAVVAASVVAVAPAQSAQQGVTVLGSARFLAPYGAGSGTAHPHRIDNGGSPSGIGFHIHWSHWGANRAIGHGSTSLHKPGGGYYRRPGRIVLRQRLSSCGNGRRAYTRLQFKLAHRPGSPVSGRWHGWTSRSDNICRSPF